MSADWSALVQAFDAWETNKTPGTLQAMVTSLIAESDHLRELAGIQGATDSMTNLMQGHMDIEFRTAALLVLVNRILNGTADKLVHQAKQGTLRISVDEVEAVEGWQFRLEGYPDGTLDFNLRKPN